MTPETPPLSQRKVLYSCVHPSTTIYYIKLSSPYNIINAGIAVQRCITCSRIPKISNWPLSSTHFQLFSRMRDTLHPLFYFISLWWRLFSSIWKIAIRNPTPGTSSTPFYLDIFQPYIRILFVLDILDREKHIYGNVDNVLYRKRSKWSIPIRRKEWICFLLEMYHPHCWQNRN